MQIFRNLNFVLFSAIILILNSCGGGSGDKVGKSIAPPPTSQTISFKHAEPLNVFVGDTLANPASGPGVGMVTYRSSNTNVASVNDQGTIMVTGVGQATITAKKEADDKYLSAIAEYSIQASGKPQVVKFSQDGPINLTVNDSFINPAVGSGSGKLRYFSSSEMVASVNEDTGLVKIMGMGTAVITAHKESDGYFAPGSASYTVNAKLAAQALSFVSSGPISASVSQTISNIATGQGIGKITYSSSDPSIASVDGAGFVNLLKVGKATISATIAADTHYQGAEASYEINAAPLAQTMSFKQPGPLYVQLNEVISNPITAPGTGLVTYKSSDQSVASVNDQGIINILGVGESTITATKAADSKYQAGTASYIVKAGVVVSSWVGNQDTLINFPFELNSFEFYRSSESNCDFTLYSSCLFGQKDILSGQTIIDTSTTLTRIGYYFLKSGDKQSFTSVDSNIENEILLKNRTGSAVISFNDKLFLIGGRIDETFLNDIWESNDGVTWKQVVGSAAFSPRINPLLVVKDNKLWLIGGEDSSNLSTQYYKNDVWSSYDGVNWTQEVAHANFEGLLGARAVLFKQSLWIVGGIQFGGVFSNTTWSSYDGVSWGNGGIVCCQFTRADHQLLEFKGKLWLIGGRTNINFVSFYKNDIWSSDDGLNWTQVVTDGGFPSDRMVSATVYNDKMWWFGGEDWNGLIQVWSSDDGISWKQESNDVGAVVNSNAKALVHKGNLILLRTDATNEVWSSSDGHLWRKGVKTSFSFE